MTTPEPPPPPDFVRLPLPPGVSEHSLDDARVSRPSPAPLAPGTQNAASQNPATSASSPRTWMNVVSFVMGLLCFFGITPFLAVVFGHLGVAAANRGEARLRGLGVTGLLLGYFWLAIALVALLARL